MESERPKVPPVSLGIVTSRYVRIAPLKVGDNPEDAISIASLATGLTVRAMEQKIDSGVWKEGEVWKQGPDGKRYLYIPGYENWVAKGRPQE